MNPYGSYEKFQNELSRIRTENCDTPITIGILICNGKDPDCKKIFSEMDRFDTKSNEFINFYIPGYCSKKEMFSLDNSEFLEPLYEIKGENFYFSQKLFNEFLEKLESQYNIEYDGEPELILIEVIDGIINCDKKIIFPLSTLEKEQKIKSVYRLFKDIFEDAKKYTDIEDFSRQGRRRQLKKSIFELIKSKIPEELLILYENDKVFRKDD